ncbi:hypothetical protein [Armatimonas sp.]|uniref:hypothetical protein n=1 Tax=Armatimonas sp. TaxID=1872638 RepID=UPI003751526A
MAIRKRILGAALSLLAVVVLTVATVVHAQVATTYSSNKRTLKVGILLVDSTDINDGRGTENTDPFIFYIADTRADLKPQNWEFINPLSPKVVTNDVAARWTARSGGVGQQYQAGQQVTKNMAAYWEVPLTDTPIQDLLQFDLLFITNHRLTRMTAIDREKLRKLVDAGGVLWLEDCGNMRMDPSGPLFLDQLQFSGNSGIGGAGTPSINIPSHPILNTPNPLSQAEIANLGDKNYGGYALVSLSDPTAAPNPEVLVNIVGNRARATASAPNGLPYIAAGNYGSGRVIATAGDSGCDINDYTGGVRTPSGGNSGAYCGENLLAAHAEDLKFLYNVVAWGSANNQYRKDPRRTGSSFEAIGAPLVPAFQVGALDALSSTTAPLVAKGVVYATGLDASSTPSVRAYNAHPSLVSGDKGIPDLALGKPYDELWRWNGAGTMPSSPTLGTVYASSTASYADFIFVTLSNGTLVKLTALLADSFGNIAPAPNTATNPAVTSGTYAGPGGATMAAPAPLLHDGKVYVVEPDGLVRCVDAASMTTLWYSYAVAQDPVYHPTGSPSLGYTRLAITNTSANPNLAQIIGSSGRTGVAASASGSSNDLMLYVPVWQENPSGGMTLRTMAYWLGARHEVILRDPIPGDFPTRAAQGTPNNKQYVAMPSTLPFLKPVVRVYTNRYDGMGNLIYTAQDNMNAGRISPNFIGQFVDQNGMVRVRDGANNPPSRGPVGPGMPENALVSVDYDVYYVTTSTTPPALTTQGDASRNPGIRVNGYQGGGEGIAMTPDDILVSAFKYVGQSNSGTPQPHTVISGDYEQFGLTRLRQSLGIFEIPGGAQGIPITFPNQLVVERPTLRNRLLFGGPLSQSGSAGYLPSYEGLTDVKPVGPPVATNDGIVYQVLRATSPSNGGPVTVVAALDMKKEIILKLPKAYNPAYRVQVSQLDIATFDPTNPGQPKIINSILTQTGSNPISIGQNMVGDATRGRIVMTDLRTAGGRFSTSLSFVVTFVPAGGNADETVVISPSALLPNNGAGTDVDPRGLPVNGSYSPLLWYYVLPGLPTSAATLAGDVLYLGIASGGRENLVALDAEPTSNDPTIRAGEQVETIVLNLAGAQQKLNHIRWVRPMAGRVSAPPVGAQGTLAANTLLGTEAFESGVTLVTDAKRIIEVDAGGAALWTLDGTMTFQVAGGELPLFDPSAGGGVVNPATATGRAVQDKKTLSRPALARRLSPSDYLICDTGNNRVVRVDRSGQVRWELTQLNNAYGVLTSVDPITLNEPTDVQLYTVFSPGGVGYEIHYLIADAGNNRIIEVADYFDTNGILRTNVPTPSGPQRGEQLVVWVSRTTQKEGRLLRFQSLQRVLTFGDTRLGQNAALYGYPTILTAVGNASTAGDSGGDTRSDFTGGSLVSLLYNPINTTIPLFNNMGAQAATITSWPIGMEPARNGLVDRTMNELVMPLVGGQRHVRRIARPTYIQQFSLPNGLGGQKSVFLICDSSGVYQTELGTDNRWYVTWYFNSKDYKDMTEYRLAGTSTLGFLPSAVKRLANGDYLITNSWIGQSSLFTSGQFVGEVFQVEGNRRFDAVTGNQTDPVLPQPWPHFSGFSSPNIVLAPSGLRWEQKMGTNSSNTNLLEHPLFGDRL